MSIAFNPYTCTRMSLSSRGSSSSHQRITKHHVLPSHWPIRCGIKLTESYIEYMPHDMTTQWQFENKKKVQEEVDDISRESRGAITHLRYALSSLPQRPAWRFEAHCRHFLLQSLFLFFLPPSLLLSPMHPSSFEGTRNRVRARAGHDRRTNNDWHLLFFSPDLTSFFSSSPPA